ncbi:MAG: EamA family transporter [Pseudomonadota bacterium]|nr:EamA family transporter [Pseudomonadota bacterium]
MEGTGTAAWLWIPIVLAAAAAQTVRNAVQRSVTKSAGVVAATFIRFAYGLPFAIVALAAIVFFSNRPPPTANASFLAWVTFGAVMQAASTAFFVAAMAQRSFVVAVVFTKSEVLQVGLYAVVFLGETLSLPVMAAMLLGTTGVLLLSGQSATERSTGPSWLSKGALLGLGAGAGLALCAVGYRGAMLALPPETPWMQGVYGLVWAQAIQTLLVGAWLLARDREGLGKVLSAWRVSMLAGLAGALASMGWFTAFAMRSAVDVRVVGLAEVLFSYAVSRGFFREPMSRIELVGIVLLVAGVVAISLPSLS